MTKNKKMTLDEMLEIIGNAELRAEKYTFSEIDIIREAFNGIKAALEKEKWIHVTERLPEKEGKYLVVKDYKPNDYIIDIAEWSNEFEFNNGFYRVMKVLAWRPLPEYHREKNITGIEEWLSTFNTDSATECFTAVQRLKESVNDRLDEGNTR